MSTTTVSGRPSPSTSPDTRGSASLVVTLVADPGAASRSAWPFTSATVSRSILNVAFDGSGAETDDVTPPDAAVPVGAHVVTTSARKRTLGSVRVTRSTLLPTMRSSYRSQHGVQR